MSFLLIVKPQHKAQQYSASYNLSDSGLHFTSNTSVPPSAPQTEELFLPSSEFFNRKVVGSHRSTGFADLGGIKADMLLCVIIVFIMTTSCLIGGIKSSGKVVYVTALLPYVCLSRGATVVRVPKVCPKCCLKCA